MQGKLKFISIILSTTLVMTLLFNSFNNHQLSALANSQETEIQIDEKEIESNVIFPIAAGVTIIGFVDF